MGQVQRRQQDLTPMPHKNRPDSVRSLSSLLLFFDPLDSPDQTVLEANFNAMGMGGRFCQDVPHNSCSEFPGSLILFQHDRNPLSNLYVVSIPAIHNVTSCHIVSDSFECLCYAGVNLQFTVTSNPSVVCGKQRKSVEHMLHVKG